MARSQQEIAREMAEHHAAIAGLWAEFANAAPKTKKREVPTPAAEPKPDAVRSVARALRRIA